MVHVLWLLFRSRSKDMVAGVKCIYLQFIEFSGWFWCANTLGLGYSSERVQRSRNDLTELPLDQSFTPANARRSYGLREFRIKRGDDAHRRLPSENVEYFVHAYMEFRSDRYSFREEATTGWVSDGESFNYTIVIFRYSNVKKWLIDWLIDWFTFILWGATSFHTNCWPLYQLTFTYYFLIIFFIFYFIECSFSRILILLYCRLYCIKELCYVWARKKTPYFFFFPSK